MQDALKRLPNLISDLRERVSLGLLRWSMAAVLAIVIAQMPLSYLESYFYDLRVQIRPAPLMSRLLHQIVIEPDTVAKIKRVPTLSDHIQLLSKLIDESPRAVVYILDPTTLKGSESEQKKFVERALSLREFYVISNELAMKGETGKLEMPGPFKALKVWSGPLTSDSTLLAQDGVTRRMMLKYHDQLMFHAHMAGEIIHGRADPKRIRGHFEFYDSEQAYIDMAPTGTVPRSSFGELVSNPELTGKFRDKIVLVGTDLQETTKEYVKTSYSRQVTAMTAVEAHANILNTLIRNSGVEAVPTWLNFLILLVLVVLSVEVVLAMKPLRGIVVLLLTLAVFALGSFIAFWPFGYWVSMAQPLLGVFVAYYFLIPYRLIVENRRSWELYQKNKLLTQVEELKTNFIGMMSHDLKTPLARISGMLEIALRDKNPLSDDQKQALKTIQKSTEDLLGFISSILNFSRIESEGIQLNLKSKDINSLIEDVLQKTDFLAREKQIKIVKELEPLFSLKVDPDLMRQVLANLIENAIHYSPDGSHVIIKTEEKNNKVIVQIIDQGMGIPEDELPRLFMKFFRSRKAKNSNVKGSGLGLFLARYFVELHGGTLTAESQENKGSTFTIELPIAG